MVIYTCNSVNTHQVPVVRLVDHLLGTLQVLRRRLRCVVTGYVGGCGRNELIKEVVECLPVLDGSRLQRVVHFAFGQLAFTRVGSFNCGQNAVEGRVILTHVEGEFTVEVLWGIGGGLLVSGLTTVDQDCVV